MSRGNKNKRLLVVIVAIVVCLAVAWPARADWQEQDKLLASDGASYNLFGGCVSVSGDYVIVGAPEADGNEVASGSAYIFKRDGMTWTEQAKLAASDGEGGDYFGFAVSISGAYAIVGAYGDDDEGSRTGSAYIFKREGTSWLQQDKLTASDGAAIHEFGSSVSISGDYAIVGAPYADGNEVASGSAYIFKREGITWTQQAKLTASDGVSGDWFGIGGDQGGSVSISADYAIVGAPGDDDNSGSAYIFEKPGSGWVNATETAKLTASDANADDRFGNSVSISADYATVGAVFGDGSEIDSGSAYIFKREGITWIQQAKLTASDGEENDGFGLSVSVSGEYAIVGAFQNDANGADSGSAYIFKRDSTSWAEQVKLTASDGAAWDYFGNSVSISADYAIVGAVFGDGNEVDSGSAYVFAYEAVPSEAPATEWTRTYGDANYDGAASVVQTSDEGYAIAGSTKSFGAGGSDFWLVKTDANGTKEWDKTYGGANDDSACSVVQTSDGGYALFGITKSFGDTTGDFWLVKVDAFGNEQWSQTYSKGPSWDSPRSMAYTSDGGFILAGCAEFSSPWWSQAWLVKTNSTGDVEWDYTYGANVGFRSTYADSVIETSDSGYAVAGYRYLNGDLTDFWLFKTDANGVMLWNKNYGGPNQQDAWTLIETSDGGYAIIGTTESLGAGGDDFWLVKTDANGTKEWDKTYGGTQDDIPRSVVQICNGGYALAGHTKSFGAGDFDAWLVRTDADGNDLWDKTYGDANEDRVNSLIHTRDGGYALAGTTKSFGAGDSDFWLIKLAPDEVCVEEPCGVVEEWVARYDAGSWDRARALAVDASGNVYVTGESNKAGTGWDYTTVKYDPNGNELWAAGYDGPGGGCEIDWCYALAVDGSGNVHVTGESWGGDVSGYDYATIKYDTNGIQQWAARYDGAGSEDELLPNDSAYALAVDTAGNVYVTGDSLGNGTEFDYATIKYGPDSNEPLWVARYNGPGNGDDRANAIAVDDSGNVYVTGSSAGDYATIKYGPDGTEQWVAQYNGPASGSDSAYALAVDGSGNVYVTGRSLGSGTGSDYATIKYDPNGTEQWVAQYDSGSAYDLAVDASGNVYVAGGSYTTIKYGPDSNEPLWVADYDGPGSGDDAAYALAVDASGNVYVTGSSYGGSGTHSNYTTVKYGPDGSQQWVVHYDGPATGDIWDYDSAYDIAVDGSGNVYVTGTSGDIEDDYATIKYSPGVCNYSLTVTKTPGGTTDPNVGTHTYPCHSFVQVTAIPDVNYLFDHWELDANNVGSYNPYPVLMDGDHTLHAKFVASLNLLSPNGGECLLAGTNYSIEWETMGVISDVLIEYSTNSGSSWTEVDPCNTGNTGTYNWLVPNVTSGLCGVRISDAGDPSVFDTSDAVFTIRECQTIAADLNNDCYVDWTDLDIFADQWLASGCGEPDWCDGADFDQSQDVNFVDFSIFASEWWECGNPCDPACRPPCPCSGLDFDLDGDGLVSLTDLMMLIACIQSGNCPPGPGTDFNCDGFVDPADADILGAILECIGLPYVGTPEQAEACCELVPR